MPMPRPALRVVLPVLLPVLLSAALIACDRQPPPAAEPAGKIYAVGTDATYAPMEMVVDSNRLAGFDIDLLQAIADKGGFRVKFLNTPFEGIFNSLLQGERDLLISSITITPERLLTVDFSDPYFETRQLIVTTYGGRQVLGVRDLRGLKVGVQSATTGDIAMQKLLGRNDDAIRRFESMPLVLAELTAGGVDAVVGDEAVIRRFISGNTRAGQATAYRTVADDSFGLEHYGIAVRKGDRALLVRINKGLRMARADGTYDLIKARYFGH